MLCGVLIGGTVGTRVQRRNESRRQERSGRTIGISNVLSFLWGGDDASTAAVASTPTTTRCSHRHGRQVCSARTQGNKQFPVDCFQFCVTIRRLSQEQSALAQFSRYAHERNLQMSRKSAESPAEFQDICRLPERATRDAYSKAVQEPAEDDSPRQRFGEPNIHWHEGRSLEPSLASTIGPRLLSRELHTSLERHGFLFMKNFIDMKQMDQKCPIHTRTPDIDRIAQSTISGGVTQYDLLTPAVAQRTAQQIHKRRQYLDQRFHEKLKQLDGHFPLDEYETESEHFKELISDHRCKDQMPHYDSVQRALVLAVYLDATTSTKVSLNGHHPGNPGESEAQCYKRWWNQGFDEANLAAFAVEPGDALVFFTTHLHAGSRHPVVNGQRRVYFLAYPWKNNIPIDEDEEKTYDDDDTTYSKHAVAQAAFGHRSPRWGRALLEALMCGEPNLDAYYADRERQYEPPGRQNFVKAIIKELIACPVGFADPEWWHCTVKRVLLQLKSQYKDDIGWCKNKHGKCVNCDHE
jgi:hypothetical protein